MLGRCLAALVASVVLVAVALFGSPGAAQAAPFSLYAGGTQTISDSVVFANFGVGKPVLRDDDTYSSATMLVQDGSKNGLEIGWTVNPGLNGDDDPHLYVARSLNGVSQCYNTECAGFTPYPEATIAVGQTFTEGTPQRFGIQHWDNRWWLWAGTPAGVGSWIGYFDDSSWTTAWPTFSKVQVYGEVYSLALHPQSDMGNGVCAENSRSLAISSVSYSTSAAVNLTPFFTASRIYSAIRLSARSIRYGGDGYCA